MKIEWCIKKEKNNLTWFLLHVNVIITSVSEHITLCGKLFSYAL